MDRLPDTRSSTIHSAQVSSRVISPNMESQTKRSVTMGHSLHLKLICGLRTEKWDSEHLTSSPGNSKANVKAEPGVKTAKRLLRKSIEEGKDPYMAILDYRNTPTQGMISSPSQSLMSRRTKTLLPMTQCVLLPKAASPEQDKRKPATASADTSQLQ